MKTKHDNFIFVLVRPAFLGNIGSVARVLKNLEFQQLRLVDPPRNYKDSEARRMSADAFDVLKQAQVHGSLSESLMDISMAIGTTAGQYRDEMPLPLSQIAPKAVSVSQKNKVAWVFGNERNGLMKEELKRCHQIVTIPTNPDCPSLNISQAVGLVAYEIVRQNGLAEPAADHPTGLMDDDLFVEIESLLNRIEFTKKFNHEVIVKELRSLYQRTQPSKREFDVLTGLIRKINRKLDQAPG